MVRLAAGATEILLRSRDQYGTLPGLPATLGTRYSGNGDFFSFGGDLDTEFAPSVGSTITTASVIRAGDPADERWFVLEEGGYSEHLAALVRSLHLSRLPAYVAERIGDGMRRILDDTRAFLAAASTPAVPQFSRPWAATGPTAGSGCAARTTGCGSSGTPRATIRCTPTSRPPPVR